MPLQWRGNQLHVTAYAEPVRVEVVAGEVAVVVAEIYTGALA